MTAIGEPELFIETPDRGTSVFGSADYCGPTGTGMLCEYRYEVISDIDDARFRRWSGDNGRTWSDPVELPVTHPRDDGTIVRRTSSACFVDPGSGHLVFSGTERIQDSDDAFDALTRLSRFYALSADGGRSLFHQAPIIQQGEGYDRWHPIDGVHTGRNAFTGFGPPVIRDGGLLLFPVSRTALDGDGRYFNPYGSSYIETGCLAARFSGDRLVAESVSWIIPDPERTTRGIFEPTLAALDGGRLLMVMRGSNGGRPELPAYKWFSVSEDEGRTWSPAEPWGYEDGERFFSPSSISHLVPHSDGRLFWFGNVSGRNADGNSPRYPLVMGQVDRATGLLLRDSLAVIADRAPDQDEGVQYSNFHVHEDRETRQLVLYVNHYQPSGLPRAGEFHTGFTGSVYRYRIDV